MPLYTYVCDRCDHEFDVILPVSNCDDPVDCPKCGEISKKIIVLGHGGIWRKGDSVPWVRDTAKILTDSDHPNPNIQTPDDLKKYLEANPNIRPKEDHPLYPSHYGDCFSRPDPKQVERERSRKGDKALREMRSITLNAGRA